MRPGAPSLGSTFLSASRPFMPSVRAYRASAPCLKGRRGGSGSIFIRYAMRPTRYRYTAPSTRTAGVRNLRRLRISESAAMKISGRKTASTFRRFDITDERQNPKSPGQGRREPSSNHPAHLYRLARGTRCRPWQASGRLRPNPPANRQYSGRSQGHHGGCRQGGSR